MADQVSGLFAKEYGVDPVLLASQMDTFYNHPYQKEECIRIVAMDGNTVAGFQSFFYWPYRWKNTLFRSFQSGNSLVNPNYRGRGVFASLLQFMNLELQKHKKIDFLTGFPIDVSKNSLLRNGWTNVVNLTWYVKPINYLSVLRTFNPTCLSESFPELTSSFPFDPDLISLSEDTGFRKWRAAARSGIKVQFFEYSEGDMKMTCALKPEKRGKFFKHLIIGDIRTNCSNAEFISNGLKLLESRVTRIRSINFLSIAINPLENSCIRKALQQRNFMPLNKRIYFMVKNFLPDSSIVEAPNWRLFRSDIDTW
ncbi:MAG: hypothetical protein IT233_10435 [Bacteroidia bacterium]|nr:hypothetical protein [Bacteroidia bacterium]